MKTTCNGMLRASNPRGYLKLGCAAAALVWALSGCAASAPATDAQSHADAISGPSIQTDQPLYVIVHVDVSPAVLHQALPILTTYVQQASHDPAVRHMTLLQQTDGANHFTLVEEMASQSAYDAFVARPYVKAMRNEIQPLLGSPFDERLHHAVPVTPAEAPDPAIVKLLAPDGTLHASINLGNAVLAKRDPQTGKPVGVSVDLATALAKRLGVPLQLVVVDSAAASVANVSGDASKAAADVGFFAIDPTRGKQISFTTPYVLIEGYYLVNDASPVKANDQVDRPGVTVAVSKGSAYDLYLTHALHHATIVRLPTATGVVQDFIDQHIDVAAGVKQQLEHDMASHPGLRLLDRRFMVIRQAMGVAPSRGEAASRYLSAFVNDMTTSGFVAASLQRHHVNGAIVAEPTD